MTLMIQFDIQKFSTSVCNSCLFITCFLVFLGIKKPMDCSVSERRPVVLPSDAAAVSSEVELQPYVLPLPETSATGAS